MLAFIFAILCLVVIISLLIIFEVEQELYFFKKQLIQDKKIVKHSDEYKAKVKTERSKLYEDKIKFFVVFIFICLGLSLGALFQLMAISQGLKLVN